MTKQDPVEFVFLRRRAQQLYQEGLPACAARLLRAVDEAQAERFATVGRPAAEDTRVREFVSTHFR